MSRSELNLNNNVTKNTRKEVNEALKDFLADIKNGNKFKPSKKTKRGSAVLKSSLINNTPPVVRSKSPLKSLMNTPTALRAKSILNENNSLSNSVEMKSIPILDMLDPTDVSKKRPAWKATPPKKTKKICTGFNIMVSRRIHFVIM